MARLFVHLLYVLLLSLLVFALSVVGTGYLAYRYEEERIEAEKLKRETEKRLAEKSPAHPALRLNRATDLIAIKSYKKAIEELEIFLKSYPESSRGWNLLGFCQSKLNLGAEAAESYKKAWQLNPEDSSAKMNYAMILFVMQDDLPRAEELVKEVLQKEPDNPQALFNLGFLSLGRKDRKSAEQYAERLLKINSDRAAELYRLIRMQRWE